MDSHRVNLMTDLMNGREAMTETERVNLIRIHWEALWKLPPAERKARIEEILRSGK